MNYISTGEPSTLKTYKGIAHVFGSKAEAFIDKKIAESPNGEDEEVVAHESQMLILLSSLEFDGA